MSGRAMCRTMGRSERLLKVALDELRMQMLGAQVLFGFQFQALFQERFNPLSASERLATAAGFVFIVATLALLIAAPSIHRFVEHGEATLRVRKIAGTLAQAALATLSFTLACNVFVISYKQFGDFVAVYAATIALICGFAGWYGLGIVVRLHLGSRHARD
jgi:hypothetical protein